MHYVASFFVLFSIVCLSAGSQQTDEFPRCPRTDGDGHCATDLKHLRPLRFTRTLIETKAHVRLFEKQLETNSFDPGYKIVAIVIGFDGSLFALDKYAFLSALAEVETDQKKMIKCVVLEDTRGMTEIEFWTGMAKREWLWLFDPKDLGPLDPAYLPRSFANLLPDPYLDLVRDLGALGNIDLETPRLNQLYNTNDKWAKRLRKVIDPLEPLPAAPVFDTWCAARPTDRSCFSSKETWVDWLESARISGARLASDRQFSGLPGYLKR